MYATIIALQHNFKEIYMFSFEDQYKKFEQLNERTKQAYEFWLETITSTWEDLFKPRKK